MGKLRPGLSRAWPLGRSQDSSKLSRRVPCARVLGKGLSVVTLTHSHPRGRAPFSPRPLGSSALPHPLFLSSQHGCLMVRPSLLHWGRWGGRFPFRTERTCPFSSPFSGMQNWVCFIILKKRLSYSWTAVPVSARAYLFTIFFLKRYQSIS